jgi:hypothetical protein
VFRTRDRLLRLVADRRRILVPSLVADRRDLDADLPDEHLPDEQQDMTALISAGLTESART